MGTQEIYQQAIKFAALKHSEENQSIPGTSLPYVVHLCNVAMEIMVAYQHSPNFNLEVAIRLALLHDTLEDTSTTFDELSQVFGADIAHGVSALTKNDGLPKPEKMLDSLNRIKLQPKEVWAVKIADRITNLQEPPKHWDTPKKVGYKKEAAQILQELKGANQFLEQRLRDKIEAYEKYI